MKSIIFYASLIMMLLVSTTAFSDILYSSSGCGSSGSADADASGSTDYEEDSESGWYFEYTDRDGYFGWEWSVYAEAYANVWVEYGKWGSATAVAQAEVSGAASASAYVSASASGTGTIPTGENFNDDPEPDSDSDDGGGHLSAYNGICGDVDVLAVAQIEEGTNCTASAEAEASASVSLYD